MILWQQQCICIQDDWNNKVRTSGSESWDYKWLCNVKAQEAALKGHLKILQWEYQTNHVQHLLMDQGDHGNEPSKKYQQR